MQTPFIFFCRPGFENDCAAEVQALASELDLAGYANAKPNDGYIRFYLFDEASEQSLFDELDIDELIFTRQWFWAKAELTDLDPTDRVSPIVELSSELGIAKSLLVEHLDSDAGRELSKFCKKISTPLTIALEKSGALVKGINEDSELQQHILFLANDHCLVGYSPAERASELKGGILRLKSPKDAPSRSSLKLDEAIQVLMSNKQRKAVFRLGHTAVDLGAAPGGWTFQLVQRGMQVTAIDNGPMDKKLMATEHVIHLKENALTWLPEKPVHILVCDMVEKPSMVANLMAKWLLAAKTEHAIFNLKLPMKKRFQEVSECIGSICDQLEDQEIDYFWQAKHLYHDREEITVYFRRKMPKLN
ncbi:MAG: 23S rRNA (cytidine(2498)-2'-O)-methyltransferase RlmM [Gammaproteobacteria bacterium]|nr:23S rRNA (cytidine(2498)-2'-O)-methyltransferase RlmM [Gammaproteobacteria bacterium]